MTLYFNITLLYWLFILNKLRIHVQQQVITFFENVISLFIF